VPNGHAIDVDKIEAKGVWSEVVLVEEKSGLLMRVPDAQHFDIDAIVQILGAQRRVIL